MASSPLNPYPGITAREHPSGAMILRVHHSADPQKAKGKKIYVPELGPKGMMLSPWAHAEYRKMTNPALYMQEYEIDGSATQGSLVYYLDREATLEDEFPIPAHWTRYTSLDPHPAVPHAMLWIAVDPNGDAHCYREFWPSRVCYRFENGIQLGKAGNCPDDEPPCRIRDYVAAVKFLESDENQQNIGPDGKTFSEKIYERVIDYAARGFGQGTQDDQKQENFQVRFEKAMKELGVTKPYFTDAIKVRASGEENVNEWLKPREVDDGKDGFIRSSRLRIMRKRCPELIYQLENNRREQLSAVQAEKHDPTGKPVQVRKHMTDNLLYICAASPTYRRPQRSVDTFEPVVEGIAY